MESILKKLVLITTITVFTFLSFYLFDKEDTFAAVNREINYQGRLLDSIGDAVDDGDYSIEFNLYTVSTSGTPIWTETQSNVEMKDGLFSVMLGSVSSLENVDFNQTLYLGINIESDGEMSPRKVLGAVPAAFVADTVDGISSEQFLRNDVVNATTSSNTFLTLVQNGAGKLIEMLDSGMNSLFTVLSNGNVGIGTSTPTEKLSVVGNMNLSGALAITDGSNLTNLSADYINFSSTIGASGFGFRNNDGVLEFKNSGGDWTALASSGGGSLATSTVAFSVHRNGVNQTVPATTYTVIDFTHEDFDTNDDFDLVSNKFQPSIEGYYQVNVSAHCAGSTCFSAVFKNGTNQTANMISGSGGSTGAAGNSSIVVYMNGTTDFLYGMVYSGGTSVTGTRYTKFDGALIPSLGSGGGSFDIAGNYTPTGTWDFSGANIIGLGSGGSTAYTNVLHNSSWKNASKTLPNNLANSQVAVIGDYIYLFGGYTGSTYTNAIYRAPVSNPISWSNTGSTLPGNLSHSQVAVIGDYVYLFGGYNGSSYTNVIYRAPVVDPTSWSNTGSTLPGNLGVSQHAIIGDYIYLFGGNTGSSNSVIYRAPVSDPTSWSNTGSTLPGNLTNSHLAVIGDFVYLFGGYNGSSYTNVIYRAPVSDPTSWSNTGSTLPSNIGSSQLVVVGDYVYLIGGHTSGSSNVIYRAPVVDPTSWSNTGSTLPGNIYNSQAAMIGSQIYLFGGWTSGYSSVIYSADISSRIDDNAEITSFGGMQNFQSWKYLPNKVGSGGSFNESGDYTPTGNWDFSNANVTGLGSDKHALIVDQKDEGVHGGTFTAGAWRKRDLNTELIDNIGVTVSNDEFTLPAGNYKISASAPAYAVNRHRIRLYNVTDSSVDAYGTSAYSRQPTSNGFSYSTITYYFTIDSPKTFRIEHLTDTTASTNGFGVPSNSGTTEMYTVVDVTQFSGGENNGGGSSPVGPVLQYVVQEYDPPAAQHLTTTHADVDGSSYSFTPKSSTSKIIYKYGFYHTGHGDPTISSFKMLLDGTLVSGSETVLAAQNYNSSGADFHTYSYAIDSWGTSTKNIKLQAREYDSSYDAKLHETNYWDGLTSSPKLRQAVLEIIEIDSSETQESTGGSFWSKTGDNIHYENGMVGIGTSTPERTLHVLISTDGSPVRFEDSNGYCGINPTSTTWVCTSDERLKENILSIASTTPDLYEKMRLLRPVTFEWKTDDTNTARIGLIAQEVEAIFPEFVTTDEETGMKSVSYGSFIPYIISVIQTLAEKVEKIAKVIDGLTASGILSAEGVLNKIVIGSSEKPAGVTLFDETSGDPYCLSVKDGNMVTKFGECSPEDENEENLDEEFVISNIEENPEQDIDFNNEEVVENGEDGLGEENFENATSTENVEGVEDVGAGSGEGADEGVGEEENIENETTQDESSVNDDTETPEVGTSTPSEPETPQTPETSENPETSGAPENPAPASDTTIVETNQSSGSVDLGL